MSMRRGRFIVFAALFGAIVFLAGCTSAGPPPTRPASSFDVSYAGAAGRLAGLDATDTADQIRDWLVVALADRLGVSTAHLRDATYDTLPIRDPGLADLSRQPSGPGRYLYDGKGVLHLLVPDTDPHAQRTIGLMLDQYRADTGADAPRAEVHHYRIDTATQSVHVTDGPVTPTPALRTANGYVSRQVDSAADLTSFLARTSYLSRLALHGAQVWADGWDWAAPAEAKVGITDVTVLQNAYLQGTPPGFSLDPEPARTAADLRAVAPGVSQNLATAIVDNRWPADGFTSASDVHDVVFEELARNDLPKAELANVGLPTDRTQLWALDSVLNGGAVYSQARYDGDIGDTAVGMTLFYTDRTAKDWVVGVGSGVPTDRAVPGFLPDDKAVTPGSECSTLTYESGRLWFGENDAAIAMHPDSVDIGARATRLFSRSNGPGGGEVEPSYAFGRGLRWWDAHYQEISDYEPQYQRLDQIMRWSEALDWLVGRTGSQLPQAPAASLTIGGNFGTWYARHPGLKAHEPIDFVRPPSASAEAIAPVPSITFPDCGEMEVEGGVSLGDLVEVDGSDVYDANLPAPVDRAEPITTDSAFDEQTGAGHITELTLDDNGKTSDTVRRVFSVATDGSVTVTSTGDGRNVFPLGDLKIWRSGSASRAVALTIGTHPGEVSEQVSLQGMDLGTLDVTTAGNDIDVAWQPGLLDRTRIALDSVQTEWAAHPNSGIPAPAAGVLAEDRTSGGVLDRVSDSPADPWLLITGKQPPAGDGVAFRLGGPAQADGDPGFGFGVFVDPPASGGAWVSATSGHGPLMYAPGHAPRPGSTAIRVSTSDGRSSRLYVDSGVVLVAANDPVLGPDGTAAAQAMLRRYGTIAQAMTAAGRAGDGLLRGMLLGEDGVALVAPDQIFLAPHDDPWTRRVQRAAGGRSATVLVLLESGQALVIDPTDLGSPGSRYTTTLGAARSTAGASVFLNDSFRSTLTFGAGPIITSSLPDDTRVTVQRFTLTAEQATVAAALSPDGRRSGGADWWLMPAGQQNISVAPAPPPAPAAASGPGDVLLVCPADTAGVAGCQA